MKSFVYDETGLRHRLHRGLRHSRNQADFVGHFHKSLSYTLHFPYTFLDRPVE